MRARSHVFWHALGFPDLVLARARRAASKIKDPESVSRATHVIQKNDTNKRAVQGRMVSTRSSTPDSRNPLIPSDVRAKIERIELDARAKGWPAELLWNAAFWDSPEVLLQYSTADDEIIEVAERDECGLSGWR